jgi:hypothetical protein
MEVNSQANGRPFELATRRRPRFSSLKREKRAQPEIQGRELELLEQIGEAPRRPRGVEPGPERLILRGYWR